MPPNECIPLKEAGYTQKITVHADAAITGKTFVAPLTQFQNAQAPGLAADPLAAGDGSNLRTPGAPAAGGQVAGVAAYDAASGAKVPIIRGAGTVLPVTAGAAITVGAEVQVDATGKVVPFAAGKKVGIAHTAAAGAGTDVWVELYPNPV
jgi:predicted RecA/RadA family phage recombinase